MHERSSVEARGIRAISGLWRAEQEKAEQQIAIIFAIDLGEIIYSKMC